MPPSGYSKSQVGSIAGFLLSCADALRVEAEGKGEPILDALRREVEQITDYSHSRSLAPSQAAVLDLTSEFYRRLEGRGCNCAQSLHDGAREVVHELGDEILAIKI